MDAGRVQIYYGEGRGKSTAALGCALQAASVGKNVFIIQFLKGKMEDESAFLQRLEPESSILILDELLGVIDNGVISKEEARALFQAKTDETQLIVTGRVLPDDLRGYADEIYQIRSEKK